ncbi:MAG: hypothetical protein LCH96_10480 [Actinobacteria bacterium]|nr:hypothetical protein [Actinomycetota bacterium]
MRSEVEQVRADGNRTSVTTPGGTESYRYDQLDQVTGVTYTDGTTANYGYDGDNLRVHATGTTAATGNLLYDRETDAAAPQLIADANGAYTWTPAGQLSQQTATATSYTLADALGSTRALTDSSGTVTATVDYDVYGNVRNQTGTWGPQGYTAGIQTGSLVTLGERDLRTDIGQFLSTDPEQPGGNGITGWNQYTYVANNPTTYVDPTGREMALEYTDVLKIGAATIVGAYAWSQFGPTVADQLQRCLASTACIPHPPVGKQPTTSAGNPATAANPPSIQDISNSLMTWATAALSETAARAAAQACEKTLGGLNLGTDPCTQTSDIRIFFEGGDIMGHTIHAAAAIAGHPAWAELNRTIPHDRGWLTTMPICQNRPGRSVCDEYPFASTQHLSWLTVGGLAE